MIPLLPNGTVFALSFPQNQHVISVQSVILGKTKSGRTREMAPPEKKLTPLPTRINKGVSRGSSDRRNTISGPPLNNFMSIRKVSISTPSLDCSCQLASNYFHLPHHFDVKLCHLGNDFLLVKIRLRPQPSPIEITLNPSNNLVLRRLKRCLEPFELRKNTNMRWQASEGGRRCSLGSWELDNSGFPCIIWDVSEKRRCLQFASFWCDRDQVIKMIAKQRKAKIQHLEYFT